ncbi:CHAT domain-containing protein [Mycena rebaudengoi]|nr:CHAT domain-containing protein [Mycena rebaudengoi]KAJ7244591.1 CHAT domain-containing protein [Mycena rebaudengoi]
MKEQGIWNPQCVDTPTVLPTFDRGPVVYLNASELRCDALILGCSPGHLQHVHLGNLYHQVIRWQQDLKVLLSRLGIRERLHARKCAEVGFDEGAHFTKLLGELWASIVVPILEVIQNSFSGKNHGVLRIWWCPTGPFAALPIHAAGLYTPYGPEITLSDFAISSYTPTLLSLISATEERPKADFKLLVVAQPSTPGASRLPGTIKEAEVIRRHAQFLPTVFLEGTAATRSEVIKHCETAPWVHLACHGVQNGTNSELLLQDGGLKVSKIFELPNTPQLEFAFLSACQTATGDEVLPDEALHIAGTLQTIGYRSIIATVFSIPDADAPIIADKVYEHLFRTNSPNYTEAAQALHGAMEHLRAQHGRGSFRSWVPFVHFGA